MEQTHLIPNITPEYIKDPILLKSRIYENPENNYYWTSDWSPEFYIELAYAGFISVGMNHKDLGYILLPEMQKAYALLDWEDIHLSKNIKRIIRRGILQEYSLNITRDLDHVVSGIIKSFGDINWLIPPYHGLLKKIIRISQPVRDFSLFAVEIRETRGHKLAAGELGYRIGNTYTSLTGFLNREEKKYNHMGTVQLICLARILKQSGFDFWNLGHPHLSYKSALGAKTYQRKDFLYRWVKARESEYTGSLFRKENAVFNCHDILSPQPPDGLI